MNATGPVFFSLTTGACEHTSSPPWGGGVRGGGAVMTKPVPFPPFLLSLSFYCPSSSVSLSHPVLISVVFALALSPLALFVISLPVYITQGDIISPRFFFFKMERRVSR